MTHAYRDTWIQDHIDTGTPLTEIQGHINTWTHGSGPHGYRDTWIQGHRDTG